MRPIFESLKTQGGFMCLSVMADYLIGWWKESPWVFFIYTSSEKKPRCFLLFICLFSRLIVLVCGKLRQHIPTTRSWVVAKNLRSRNTVNINIKPAAAIFPPKLTIYISTLPSGAQPVCTTDPREHVLLRGWKQNHCQHQSLVREVLVLMDLNQMIQKLK